MINLEDYPLKYPNMIEEILNFFAMESENGKVKHKNVMEFLEYYNNKFHPKDYPQPRDVSRVCQLLCEYGPLSLVSSGGLEGLDSIYFWPGNSEWKSNVNLRHIFARKMSCAIYGFKYIYELFRPSILPIIHYLDEDIGIGTGFCIFGGIATAKHCIEGANRISIKGISKEQLSSSKIWISDNRYMDIAFIDLHEKITNEMTYGAKPSVMDEVITMGYPKIPGFTHFQTVEKATVSAIPSKRFASATGSVAAEAKEIWMKENLFLITAKIKGGNSGGPVLNKFGEVVGISSELTFAEGDYDDLGYGTAIPIEFLYEILIKKDTQLDAQKIQFIDFKEED